MDPLPFALLCGLGSGIVVYTGPFVAALFAHEDRGGHNWGIFGLVLAIVLAAISGYGLRAAALAVMVTGFGSYLSASLLASGQFIALVGSATYAASAIAWTLSRQPARK